MKTLVFTLVLCLLLPVSAMAEEITEPEGEVIETEVVEPEVSEPEVLETEVPETEVTEPEVSEPEPEVTEPEITEQEIIESEISESEVTPETTEPEVTEAELFGGSSGDSGLTEDDVLAILEEYQEDEVTTLYTVSTLDEYDIEPASDAEEQTMRDVVALVFGEYTPRTQTVTEHLSDGSSVTYTEVVSGVAGLDWEWITGAGLFALAMFSFFKIVGVFLKNG